MRYSFIAKRLATALQVRTWQLLPLLLIQVSLVASCGGGSAQDFHIESTRPATNTTANDGNQPAFVLPTPEPSQATPEPTPTATPEPSVTPTPTTTTSPVPSPSVTPAPTPTPTVTPMPTPTPTPTMGTNINGIPYNPNALASFDPNTLDDEAGQYPACLYCASTSFTPVASCPAQGIGTSLPCESFCHINVGDIANDYTTNPPASGNHYPTPEYQTGEHISPVARGNWIHSMEHGAVILAYNCPQGCAAQLSIFRQALAMRSGHKIIMTPDPMLSTSIAMVSWTWLDLAQTPTLADVLCFIDQHENNARENLPLNAH